MEIWAELVEAYRGINRYGGHTAEIYAYRLAQNSPCANLLPQTILGEKARIERNDQAADSLCEICELFLSRYSAEITLEDLALAEWRKAVGNNFDHRVHITIMPKK